MFSACVGLAGLVTGHGVDLGLLGPAVGSQQRDEHGHQRGPLLRRSLQLLEDPLHLPVVLHDQVDDVRHGLLRSLGN